MRVFALFALTCFVLSCQREHARIPVEELDYVATWEIPLELTASPVPQSVQMNYETDEFSFFEQSQGTLYVYDFSKKTLKDSVTFSREGPNGTGNYSRMGHCYLGPDSVFLFNNSTFSLMAYTGDGRLEEEFRLNGFDNSERAAFPDVQPIRPLTIIDNKAIIMGMSVGLNPVEDHTQLNQLRVLDLHTGNITYTYPRIDKYNDGYWGNVMRYNSSYTFNPHKNQMICANGLDHDLSIYDLEGKLIDRIDAKINGFPQDFKPLRKDKDARVSKEEARKYGHTTASYYAVLYDPYKKLIYRFATPPQTTEEYVSNSPLRPIVAVYDQEYEKIGAYVFPDKVPLRFNALFVGPEGIYVNTPQLQEGFMSFYIFNVPV